METTPRGAKKVVVADSATAFREAINANAALLEAPMLTAVHAASFAGKTGELAMVTATATDTLPAAAANAIHGVFTTAGTTTINAAGAAKIYGDFINAAASIHLLANQHVILQSDGTNWFIIAGEPKQEQTYGARTARALATAFTPNATRPTQVVIDLSLEPTPGFGKNAKVFVNGGLVTELFAGGHTVESGYRMSTSFVVPPGQTWQVNDGTGSGGVGGLFSTYLTL
jgi:hypothetical protein